MAGWETLPAELRIEIWHHARHDSGGALPVAALAVVNKEWQSFFEVYNFETLTIEQDDVADFGRTIPKHGRLCHLSHLRFHLRLPVYDCAQSETEEGLVSALAHEHTFTIAIFSLLDILATEENRLSENMGKNHPGLTLELSAASISDGEHLFKDLRLSNVYEKILRRYPNNPNEAFLMQHRYDFEPSFAHQCTSWHGFSLPALNRVHGYRPLELREGNIYFRPEKRPVKMVRYFSLKNLRRQCVWNSWSILLLTNRITGLFTRRQYYRSFSTSALSSLIRNCLPNLLSVRIERPQGARLYQRQLTANALLQDMLYSSLPRKLQSLHLFDDRSISNGLYDEAYQPTTDLGVSEALWRVCHMFPELRSFSACSVIDATDFFSHWDSHSFVEDNPWAELKTLCLTSRDLMPDPSTSSEGFEVDNERVVWKLLTDATDVAQLMPKLKVLELWRTQNERACAWTYYKSENRARIIVRGVINPGSLHRQPNEIRRLKQMAKTWAEYATKVLHRNIMCEVLWLPGTNETNTSPWRGWGPYYPSDIVKHLELAGTILHPTSLHQMTWDNFFDRGRGTLDAPKPIYTIEERPYNKWQEWEDLEADWHRSDPWAQVELIGADSEGQVDQGYHPDFW